MSEDNKSSPQVTVLLGAACGRNDTVILVSIVTCFALSGFAALLYQTAWLRQFSLVFGTSELAVATVLATYMAGLAVGAAIAARLVSRIRRPILVYGLLEAGIAISALAVPLLLAAASMLYAKFLGGQPTPPSSNTIGQPLFYLVVGFVVLVIPTGFMGATLPLLIRHAVQTDSQVGPRVALLYAMNTFGAVAGTLVAGFVLLPALGLNATVWCGVAVNFVVFIIAALLAKRLPLQENVAALEKGKQSAPAVAAPTRWILPLILASGFNAFLYEVLWTRMLSHVLGGSIYAFATMLAAFLTGIALGSAVAGRFARTRQQAGLVFAATQVAIAVMSMAAYAWMQTLIPETRTLASNATYAFAVLLPATLFIGATFPLAVRVLSRSEDDAGKSTARVYAWNTVGAIFGAVFAGFVLIPALGFEGTIRLAVLINFLIALVAFAVVRQQAPQRLLLAAATIVAVAVIYQPDRPAAVINASGFDLPDYERTEEAYFSVGRSSTVLLIDRGSYFDLRTNGLPEASIAAKGVPPTGFSEKWLTALPVAARPDAKSMLVIGFGGGVALEGIPPSVEDVDVIELEPDVIAANATIADLRGRDPLADPRVNVIINDARNALRLSDKKYDIVVSQPSHPWTAGASHLFTREFVAIVKEHLNDSGVLLQWINSEFVDAGLLQSLAATLRAEFSYVRLYQPEATVLMFLASNEPLRIEHDVARTGRPLRDHFLFYSYVGINTVDDLLASLALDDDGIRSFSEGAALSTDNNNLMATRSRIFGDGLSPRELSELLAPFDPLLNQTSWTYSLPGAERSMSYLGQRLLGARLLSRLEKLIDARDDLSDKYLLTGLRLDYDGRRDEAAKAYRAALTADPLDQNARYLAIEIDLGRLARNRASAETSAIAAGLESTPAAVVAGWRLALAQDWRRLAALDRALAPANISDPWYGKAVQLRAEWRTKVVGESSRRHAFDAMRLIDRALQISPALDLYVLRAAAAAILDDGNAFVESAAFVVEYIRSKLERAEEDEYRISAEEFDAMKGRVDALLQGLSSVPGGNNPRRSANVQTELEKIREALQAFKLQPNLRVD